jgi:2-polyprenyl-6-methoxyphenol hydroxylase-like FAD-dependent oxidoreductase
VIVGGGIGGLAAAVALRKVGIDAAVFEKAPQIAEIGAGVSLWSNALIALRRLGLEARAVAAGAIIDYATTVLPHGKALPGLDVAALGAKAGAPTICIRRGALQHLLLETALAAAATVETGRECIGFTADGSGCIARFADGSGERGDVLIGADGIHSAIRLGLFGKEELRFPKVLAWRGIAHGIAELLAPRRALAVMGSGAHAGFLHCGDGDIYWFLTRNAAPGSQAGQAGNKVEILALTAGWGDPARSLLAAAQEGAILRNDIYDRRTRDVWGAGRVTLLGDAAHPMTPNFGQGACQALEDAVVLADALRRAAPSDAGLRAYETRRRERAHFVVAQSWRFGRILQLANPVGVWLRDRLAVTSLARRQNDALFTRLLCDAQLPKLD